MIRDVIQRDFGSDYEKVRQADSSQLKVVDEYSKIPPHGRWRHLDAGRARVEPMITGWKASPSPPDDKEICKRLIDLFLVSVLLDAGAGNIWTYKEPGTDHSFSRSEGLGVASIHMFQGGFFSGEPTIQPCRVDGDFRVLLPLVPLHVIPRSIEI